MERKNKRNLGLSVNNRKPPSEEIAVNNPQLDLVQEDKVLISKLHRVSINARRRAKRRNAAVTVIRNGKIIKYLPGKKGKAIGDVKKYPINIDISKPLKIK
jgi:hypothetical protein